MDKNYIFPFIRYVKPMWYFNLNQVGEYALWVDYNKLPIELKNRLVYDNAYLSTDSALRDLAYQAFQKGIVISDPEFKLALFDSPGLIDNYRFIRKYFNSFWVVLILMLRLFSFVNPIKELKAFFTTGSVSQGNVFQGHLTIAESPANDSTLLDQNPKVSIVIPTLNRYDYLIDVLRDLEKQSYANFEVLVCDQTSPVSKEFYKQFKLDLKLFIEEEKALWNARNLCIRQSSGQYILLFDDDSRVDPDWIEQHLRCISKYKVQISSGVSLSTIGAKVPENYSYFRWGDQLDTGNAMIDKTVFNQVGLFDRQFEKQRMGDGEFGLRCYLAGIKNVSNPLAKRIHLKVSQGGLRQMGSWDAFRPKKIFSPRPIPSVLYLVRKYFGTSHAKYLLVNNLAPSLIPYKYKGSRIFALLSFPLLILMIPVISIQVCNSWRKATKMLKEGAKIEPLL